jgi:hypothetical protein
MKASVPFRFPPAYTFTLVSSFRLANFDRQLHVFYTLYTTHLHTFQVKYYIARTEEMLKPKNFLSLHTFESVV